MKSVPPELASHLAGSVTTLAACWLVTRRDGVVLGFTDHDRSLMVEGVETLPQNGLSGSRTSAGPGLATSASDVAGRLDAAALSETDLAAGLWDGAEVRVYLVNWQAPDEALLLRRAHIGEVRREGLGFTAELRGLAHLLEAPRGRVFSRNCDADLGDHRCKVDLAAPGLTVSATVAGSNSADEITVTGIEAQAAGWFAGGRLEVLDGGLAGFATEITRHERIGTDDILHLWLPAPVPLAPGTALDVRTGCDKRFLTCAERFSNAANFQGFPHMPGTDFVLSFPGRNTAENDGGALG